MESPYVKCLLVIVGCALLYGCSRLLARRCPKKAAVIHKATLWVMFAAYLLLLISFTLFDSYFSRKGFSALLSADAATYAERFSHNTNFIPFKTIWGYCRRLFSAPTAALLNLGGNLAAFMPFAFFLPRLFPKQKSLKTFFFTMVGIVCAVEVLQFVLMTGFTDVDDLILNVAGALLACLLLPKLLPVLQKIRSKLQRKSQ